MSPPRLADRLLAAWARRRWRGFFTASRLLGRSTLAVNTRYGATLELRPSDYIDGIILHDGYYEPEVFDALRPHLTPGAVLWDIGANFGQHAVSAAVASPATQVYAFEPNPVMAARLEANARLNGAAVKHLICALSDHDGTGTLHINSSGNPGMTTLNPWSEGTYDRRLEVRLVHADTLIAAGEVPAPNVIKLDVEGAEAAVLGGFGEMLRSIKLRAIVFETRADLPADPSQCPAARQLIDTGFHFQALPRAAAGSEHALANFAALRASP